MPGDPPQATDAPRGVLARLTALEGHEEEEPDEHYAGIRGSGKVRVPGRGLSHARAGAPGAPPRRPPSSDSSPATSPSRYGWWCAAPRTTGAASSRPWVTASREFGVSIPLGCRGSGCARRPRWSPFVGDPHRFRSGRRFAAYLGLTPGEHSSGNVRRLGRITKHGNSYLRMMLIHGARSALRAASIAAKPDGLSSDAEFYDVGGRVVLRPCIISSPTRERSKAGAPQARRPR